MGPEEHDHAETCEDREDGIRLEGLEAAGEEHQDEDDQEQPERSST